MELQTMRLCPCEQHESWNSEPQNLLTLWSAMCLACYHSASRLTPWGWQIGDSWAVSVHDGLGLGYLGSARLEPSKGPKSQAMIHTESILHLHGCINHGYRKPLAA